MFLRKAYELLFGIEDYSKSHNCKSQYIFPSFFAKQIPMAEVRI
jgi:hypothetical protein